MLQERDAVHFATIERLQQRLAEELQSNQRLVNCLESLAPPSSGMDPGNCPCMSFCVGKCKQRGTCCLGKRACSGAPIHVLVKPIWSLT